MPAQNVLVIGTAKTGTTVISKAIQHSIPGAEYSLEPKNICFFEHGPYVQSKARQVIKIIFEHWDATPRLRNAVVCNETKTKFSHLVAIRRDIRDELISRLLYVIFPYLHKKGHKAEIVEPWIALWREKESNPSGVSIRKLMTELERLTGHKALDILRVKRSYVRFLQDHCARFLVIDYESFIQGEVKELETYLGVSLNLDGNVDQLGRTRRSAHYNNWKTYFTPEDVDFFRPKLDELLTAWDYTDWEITEVDTLDAAHCSGYIERLVREAQQQT